MNGFKDLEEITAYRAKVTHLLEQMDVLHQASADARQRHDEFMEKHQLEPGCGGKILTGDRVEERDRKVFRQLLDAYKMMDDRIADHGKSQSGKAVPVNARAVGNRFRI